MVIRKFREQAAKRPGKVVVKSGEKIFTYDFLDKHSNRLAQIMGGRFKGSGSLRTAALLLGHNAHMIMGMLGALKAGVVYIPFDPSYPMERLAYMLMDADIKIVVTDNEYITAAMQMVSTREQVIPIINIDELDESILAEDLNIPKDPIQVAYILYTSGSTGRPKGVGQNQENIFYYIRNWTQRFSLSDEDRMSLFSSFSHDGAIPDIFGALLNGALLCPYDTRKDLDFRHLREWLIKERITIWHSVPTFYRYFVSTLNENDFFSDLRLVILGGEQVRPHDIVVFKKFFPYSKFGNIYGQTESTVSSIWLFSPVDKFNKIVMGEFVDHTEVFLVNENGDVVEELEIGEVVLAGHYLSPGYVNNQDKTAKAFTYNSEFGRLYWTGDLGRLLPDGNIEILGRKDFQVKIRGFRIEPGEIESVILHYKDISEVVVTVRTTPAAGGESKEKIESHYLCAYFVSPREIRSAELREYLAQKLPDYMIPAFFVQLEEMPLTVTGKINRKMLPAPGIETGTYIAPRDEVELHLTQIWSEILGIEENKISIDAVFFELGGQSLKATLLAAKIHEKLNLKISIAEVFRNPTVRELAKRIKGLTEDKYAALEPVEKKEYYPLSSAQRRLYFLQALDEKNLSYNIFKIVVLDGNLDRERFEHTFRKLIHRHESLRTSFMMTSKEPAQNIHPAEKIAFEIEYHDLTADGQGDVTSIMNKFRRPFDLTEAPLLRAGLIKRAESNYVLAVDMHHIVTDGFSTTILVKDFLEIYSGVDLLPLKIQYKDYSQWLNRQDVKTEVKKQEGYWLNEFAGGVPQLNIPLDFERPELQSFDGNSVIFEINGNDTRILKELAFRENVTLFMVLLAVFNVLLAKLTGQEDILVGTGSAGRKYEYLHQTIGMFVNTLVLRNYPVKEKTFRAFLKEVKEKMLLAFENQDFQFEDLVEKVVLNRDMGRNPLFDVCFMLQDIELKAPDIPKQFSGLPLLTIKPYEYNNRISRFDMTFFCAESMENLIFNVEYCSKLFKKETIERFIGYFKEIVTQLTVSIDVKLKDIVVSHRLLSAAITNPEIELDF